MPDSPGHPAPYFFVHVMKTAGMTFNQHIHRNFDDSEIYPGPDDTTGVDYWVIDRLRDAVADRRDRVRVWRGHFPFFVTGFVPEAITMTLLREPVDRTISLLDQRRRLDMPDKTIEEVYDDPTVFGREVHNHQTKMFSLTEADDVKVWTKVIDLDDARLDVAKATLETVDLLGFQEHFGEFLEELEQRYRWVIAPVGRVNAAGESPTVSDSFRRRIAEDNALDMELYDYAVNQIRVSGRS